MRDFADDERPVIDDDEHPRECCAELAADGAMCGEPADLHCPLCARALCFTCARLHCAATAPDCRPSVLASAAP